MKSASVEAPHEIGKCCSDLGRARFLDKVQALDVSCVSGSMGRFRRKCWCSSLVVFLCTIDVIFIQWIEKFKNKPISIEASDNDAEPFDLS